MEDQLKDLYGRRITPVVKIFVLVVIIFLGIGIAFIDTDHSDKEQVDREMVGGSVGTYQRVSL